MYVANVVNPLFVAVLSLVISTIRRDATPPFPRVPAGVEYVVYPAFIFLLALVLFPDLAQIFLSGSIGRKQLLEWTMLLLLLTGAVTDWKIWQTERGNARMRGTSDK